MMLFKKKETIMANSKVEIKLIIFIKVSYGELEKYIN